jgi:hypothetical protein
MSAISVEGLQRCDTTNYLKTILLLTLPPFPFTREAVLPVPISQNLQADSGEAPQFLYPIGFSFSVTSCQSFSHILPSKVPIDFHDTITVYCLTNTFAPHIFRRSFQICNTFNPSQQLDRSSHHFN